MSDLKTEFLDSIKHVMTSACKLVDNMQSNGPTSGNRKRARGRNSAAPLNITELHDSAVRHVASIRNLQTRVENANFIQVPEENVQKANDKPEEQEEIEKSLSATDPVQRPEDCQVRQIEEVQPGTNGNEEPEEEPEVAERKDTVTENQPVPNPTAPRSQDEETVPERLVPEMLKLSEEPKLETIPECDELKVQQRPAEEIEKSEEKAEQNSVPVGKVQDTSGMEPAAKRIELENENGDN